MNRRNFLTGLGLASGSLFLPSLKRVAHAHAEGPPPRLVVFFTQHGVYHDTWKITAGAGPADKAWNIDLGALSEAEFSPTLRPLAPFAKRLGVIDGLAMVSAEADLAGAIRHELGQVHALSGAMTQLVSGHPMSSAPSIDQIVAEAIARPDRLRSLETAVGNPPTSVNYRAATELLPFENRPEIVYQRLFGLLGGGADTARLRQQAAALAHAGERYAALAADLGAADRSKLERHRDLLSELELRVTGIAESRCEAPLGPAASAGEYGEDYSTLVQLITAGFSCDLLRVATIHLGDIPGRVLGEPGADFHFEHAHDIYFDPTAQAAMTAYQTYHASQFAELLRALDSVPEGDGTMLDNTMCLWVSELADGAHGFERWPVVYAGGRALRTGRYVHLPSTTPFAGLTWDGGRMTRMGVPHQKLLSTIARGFGAHDAEGNPYSSMPVRELVGIDGARIDCTGLLTQAER